MKYIKVEWPEIQDYMERSDYKEEVYFDPNKNAWFIPDWWESEKELEDEFIGGDIRNLEDAME